MAETMYVFYILRVKMVSFSTNDRESNALPSLLSSHQAGMKPVEWVFRQIVMKAIQTYKIYTIYSKCTASKKFHFRYFGR